MVEIFDGSNREKFLDGLAFSTGRATDNAPISPCDQIGGWLPI